MVVARVEGRGQVLGWFGNSCNKKDKLLFAACTSIAIGDVVKTSFWNNAWLRGQRPRDIVPNIFAVSKRKNRMLRAAIQNQNWIRDINLQHESFSPTHFQEFVTIWTTVQDIRLTEGTQDAISWKLAEDGNYTAKSAYNIQFVGSTNNKL